MAKFGMSMCVLGMAEEFSEQGVAVNALWPRTTIATAAVRNLLGGDEMCATAASPISWATRPTPSSPAIAASPRATSSSTTTCCAKPARPIFDQYAVEPGAELIQDFFV